MRHSHRIHRGQRRGFLLPLSLLVLTVLLIAAGALVDASLHELRMARDSALSVRAELTTDDALASILSSGIDSAFSLASRGVVRRSLAVNGKDSVITVLQSLGGSLVRASVSARVRDAGRRADARVIAFLMVVPDSAGPAGALRLQRLPGRAWTTDP